jgi:hypothetical protein
VNDSDYRKALGVRISDLRKQWRMSQSELADRLNEASDHRLGLTQNAISRVELGIRTLPFLEGVYMAKVFEVDIAALANVHDQPMFRLAPPGDRGPLKSCPVCGVGVVDMDAHLAWHDGAESVVVQAGLLTKEDLREEFMLLREARKAVLEEMARDERETK